MSNRKKISYIVLISSFILLIINLLDFDYYDLKNNKYSMILSNILLIIAMTFNIKQLNKNKNE
jgi:hypothetical protein